MGLLPDVGLGKSAMNVSKSWGGVPLAFQLQNHIEARHAIIRQMARVPWMEAHQGTSALFERRGGFLELRDLKRVQLGESPRRQQSGQGPLHATASAISQPPHPEPQLC